MSFVNEASVFVLYLDMALVSCVRLNVWDIPVGERKLSMKHGLEFVLATLHKWILPSWCLYGHYHTTRCRSNKRKPKRTGWGDFPVSSQELARFPRFGEWVLGLGPLRRPKASKHSTRGCLSLGRLSLLRLEGGSKMIQVMAFFRTQKGVEASIPLTQQHPKHNSAWQQGLSP